MTDNEKELNEKQIDKENVYNQYYEKLKDIPVSELDKLVELYDKYVEETSNRADKWKNDPEYRKKRLESMKKYNKKRYDIDVQYREKKKVQAKERYHHLKLNSSCDSFSGGSTNSTPRSMDRRKKKLSITSTSSSDNMSPSEIEKYLDENKSSSSNNSSPSSSPSSSPTNQNSEST
jgi:hypothetical protein